jgi:hypothetical protein
MIKRNHDKVVDDAFNILTRILKTQKASYHHSALSFAFQKASSWRTKRGYRNPIVLKVTLESCPTVSYGFFIQAGHGTGEA